MEKVRKARCNRQQASGEHVADTGCTEPDAAGHLRIREGATAGNRGVPGLLEYREVAARGTPAPHPAPPTPRAPHALRSLHATAHPAFYTRLNRKLNFQ
ncbi:unnamed protein product [Colias eurytheme]|nr:unnamed protein product [Colias eurytheme]